MTIPLPGRFFTLNGNLFSITGTHDIDGACFDDVKNTVTGQSKQMKREDVLVWFRKAFLQLDQQKKDDPLDDTEHTSAASQTLISF